MAKAKAERPSFTFSKGLNTDAPLVMFPPDFSTDEVNFELMLDGTRRKRRGLEAEGSSSELPIPVSEGFAVRTFKWRSVNSSPELNFHVWQIGYTLVFADDVPNPTDHLRTFTLDLRTLGVSGHDTDNEIGQNPIDMAFGRGHAIITGKYINPTLLVYDEEDDEIQPNGIAIFERDFQGIEDGFDNQTKPGTLTDQYAYNLVNQGWVYGDILTFHSEQGVYPAKNMLPWLGFRRQVIAGINPDDGTKQFSSDKLIAELFQDAPAPKGHFIQNPFDTNVNVQVDSETIKNYVSLIKPAGHAHFDQLAPPGSPPQENGPNYMNLPGPGNTPAVTLLTFKFDKEHFLSVGEAFTLYNESLGRVGSFGGDGNRNFTIGNKLNLNDNTNGGNDTGLRLVETVVDDFTVSFYNTLIDDGAGWRNTWPHSYWPTMYTYAGGTVLDIEGRVIDERPTCSAFFAGRAWYAGVPNQALGSALYFSQVVEVDAQYGKCYQVADPTDENISDLIPTDGGVLRIPEMGRVRKLLPYSSYLLVFASNGVWQIGPGQSGYFTANSYSVRKISDIGCESGASVILAEEVPVYWGRSGVIAIVQDTNTGFLTAQSITKNKIDNFYKAITEEDRRGATGDFDEINKRLVWVYSEENDDIEPVREYKALVYDTRFDAFTPWAFGVTVHDIFTTTDSLSTDTSTLRFIVTTDFGTTEIATATSTDFQDFGTDAYEAYLVTGYDTAQSPTRFKYAPVITSFMKRPGPSEPETSFFLTSRPYPIEVLEELYSEGGPVSGRTVETSIEELVSSAVFLSGTLDIAFVDYPNWPEESVDSTSSLLSGTLVLGLITYVDWPEESVDSTADLLSGTLVVGLIEYTNWPAESVDSTASLLSGTLV